MKRRLISRLYWPVATLIGLSFFIFLLLQWMPGDPAEIWLRSRGIPVYGNNVEETRQLLGLHQPFYIRYLLWLKNMIRLDLGMSFRTGQPVIQELIQRIPATVQLLALSFILACLVSIPTAMISVRYCNRLLDHLIRVFSVLGSSLPQFWVGLMLLYWFAVRNTWLPLMGNGGISHYILPCITISFAVIPLYVRILRSGMLDAMHGLPYQAARARGVYGLRLYFWYALYPALPPFVTVLSNSIGYLWGAAFIVESIFSWTGVGKFVLDSIFARDYPVIQAFTLLMAVVIVISNLLVDLLYSWMDPRVREGDH